VELAGALAYMTRHSLPRDFRRIDTTQARILLLEGLPRVLSTYPEELSERARRDLEKLGVEVRTGALVTEMDDEGVSVGDTRIRARTLLWGAGVAASPLARTLGVALDRAGRVKVEATLNVPGHDDVFVIGDLAALLQDGKPVPNVAPAAMQMGRHVAKNIRRQREGLPLEPFRYQDRGSFAVIGRGSAIGVMFDKVRLRGRPAWFTWLGIHIAFLIGFRNRVAVMLHWAFTYFTKRRDVRLITGLHAQRLPPIHSETLHEPAHVH
jgi:NADH dehydrogenase